MVFTFQFMGKIESKANEVLIVLIKKCNGKDAVKGRQS
jgi:hypothetical protein